MTAFWFDVQVRQFLVVSWKFLLAGDFRSFLVVCGCLLVNCTHACSFEVCLCSFMLAAGFSNYVSKTISKIILLFITCF